MGFKWGLLGLEVVLFFDGFECFNLLIWLVRTAIYTAGPAWVGIVSWVPGIVFTGGA